MRRIVKGREPACLENARKTPDADTWNAMPGDCKQLLREAAFTEQHGLCAYCQSRLSSTEAARSEQPEQGGMKIEHWAARHASPGQVFEWSNLLGVCPGVVVGADDSQGQAHCDTHRGRLRPEAQALHHHPARFPPDVSTKFRYTISGEICGKDDEAQQDIARLNLNVMRLQRNRAGVIRRLREELSRSPQNATLIRLYQKATRVDREGRLPAYSQVAVYYLEKKIRQRNLSPSNAGR